MKRRGSLVQYLKNFFHSKAVRLDVYLSDEKGTIYNNTCHIDRLIQ